MKFFHNGKKTVAICFRAFKSYVLGILPFFTGKEFDLWTKGPEALLLCTPDHPSQCRLLRSYETEITPVALRMGHYDNVAHQLCAHKSFTKTW